MRLEAAGAVQPPEDSKPSEIITWPDRQLQRKYGKHAADFGVLGNYTAGNASRFKLALEGFVDQPCILKVNGTYRGHAITFYTDPGYGMVVLVSSNGEFISGWRLNTQQSINLRERSAL